MAFKKEKYIILLQNPGMSTGATITFIIYADESIKLPVNKLLNIIQIIFAQIIFQIGLHMKIRIKIMDTAIPYWDRDKNPVKSKKMHEPVSWVNVIKFVNENVALAGAYLWWKGHRTSPSLQLCIALMRLSSMSLSQRSMNVLEVRIGSRKAILLCRPLNLSFI